MLRRIDLDLGDIVSVFAIDKSDNVVLIFKSYLLIWSVSQFKVVYKSPKLFRKDSLRRYDYLLNKFYIEEKRDSVTLFLYADEFGELLSVNIDDFVTYHHEVGQFGYLDIHVSIGTNEVYLLDFKGSLNIWDINRNKISFFEKLSFNRYDGWSPLIFRELSKATMVIIA